MKLDNETIYLFPKESENDQKYRQLCWKMYTYMIAKNELCLFEKNIFKFLTEYFSAWIAPLIEDKKRAKAFVFEKAKNESKENITSQGDYGRFLENFEKRKKFLKPVIKYNK